MNDLFQTSPQPLTRSTHLYRGESGGSEGYVTGHRACSCDSNLGHLNLRLTRPPLSLHPVQAQRAAVNFSRSQSKWVVAGGLETLLFLFSILQTRFADRLGMGQGERSRVCTSTLDGERGSRVIEADTQGEGATWDKVTMVAVAALLAW